MSPVMCFVGGMYLSDLQQEAVFEIRVDLVRVAQADLRVRHPGAMRELLVDKLRSQHRRRLLDGVGGREIVVLAGVDNNPGLGVEHARKMLVDERAAHVDVAEKNPVHRVVEQHVEPLERGERCDLRHAETARVVRQHDVAAETLAGFVERGAHDAEVFLRRVGTAEPFGRRAFGDVVEQRLSRRANDGDDLRAGFGGRHRGCAVLVDVAARDDDVQERRRQLRQAREQRLALAAPFTNPFDRAFRTCAHGGAIAERHCGTMAQLRGGQAVDGGVDVRHAVGVGTLDAQKPQDRPLDGDRRVRGDVAGDRVDDPARQGAAPLDRGSVDPQLHAVFLVNGERPPRF
jgi:hypothetical protein